MSKKIFTQEEIEILKQNKYVKNVSPKGITYTEEMKQSAIFEMENGAFASEIFIKAGFDIRILGEDRFRSALKRWKQIYKEHGIIGLQDTRKGKSGRPLKRELSLKEKLKKLEARNKFLEVQLEFQKKLDMIERGVYIPKGKKK